MPTAIHFVIWYGGPLDGWTRTIRRQPDTEFVCRTSRGTKHLYVLCHDGERYSYRWAEVLVCEGK